MNRRSKKMTAFLCVVFILVSMFCSGYTAVSAEDSNLDIRVYVNGVRVEDGVLINRTTYVSVRRFCNHLSRELSFNWDASEEILTVSAPGLLFTAKLGDQFVTANDRCFYVENGVSQIDGEVALPVRVLAKIFNARVEWTSLSAGLNVDIEALAYPQSAEAVYDSEDYYWLSHLIFAEAGNQSLEGMIAVGNVVLNRVDSSICPDTIFGVISQANQFDVYSSGSIYAEPNELSLVAAKLCLEGVKAINEGLYFVNPHTGSVGWFRANLTYITTIQDHEFYA